MGQHRALVALWKVQDTHRGQAFSHCHLAAKSLATGGRGSEFGVSAMSPGVSSASTAACHSLTATVPALGGACPPEVPCLVPHVPLIRLSRARCTMFLGDSSLVVPPPPGRTGWLWHNAVFLAFPVVGPCQAWLRAGLSWARSTNTPSTSWSSPTSTSRGKAAREQCPIVTLLGGDCHLREAQDRQYHGEALGWGKLATKTACGRAESPREGVLAVLFAQLCSLTLRVLPSPCSQLQAAARGQRTAEHWECNTRKAAGCNWGLDPNPWPDTIYS